MLKKNKNNNTKNPIYIIYRHHREEVHLCFWQNKFIFTTEIFPQSIILVLEPPMESYGNLLFLKYPMKNIFYLYEILHTIPQENLVFFFQHLTILFKKKTHNQEGNSYSLFSGEDQMKFLEENVMAESLIVGESFHPYPSVDLHYFLHQVKTLPSHLSIRIIFFLRAYKKYLSYICFLLLMINSYLIYDLYGFMGILGFYV